MIAYFLINRLVICSKKMYVHASPFRVLFLFPVSFSMSNSTRTPPSLLHRQFQPPVYMKCMYITTISRVHTPQRSLECAFQHRVYSRLPRFASKPCCSCNNLARLTQNKEDR